MKKIANVFQNKGSKLRQIAIPTTLSGGEYSNMGGAMDTKRQLKERYLGIDICPQVVILDPEITLHTPDWLWLSTAIRSVDHAVEGFCSFSNNPLIEPMALHSLKAFSTSLRETYKHREGRGVTIIITKGRMDDCKEFRKCFYGSKSWLGIPFRVYLFCSTRIYIVCYVTCSIEME